MTLEELQIELAALPEVDWQTLARTVNSVRRTPGETDLALWRDNLVSWRKTLCDQLLALPPRSPLQNGLKLSILRIDRHNAMEIGNLPLDDLMREAGYASWLGCLPTVERLLKEQSRA